MAQSGTQTSKVACGVASDPHEPVTRREPFEYHPSILMARELIREARQQVARSHQLIERGRKLRQKAEVTMEAFRLRHAKL